MRVREAPEALNVLLQLAEDDVGAIASKVPLIWRIFCNW